MRVVRRDSTRGYLDTWLWVPKQFINVNGTKEALTWVFSDSHSQEVRYVYLWRETEHHLLLPRAFWKARDLPFDVMDCRPRTFPSTNITSKIKLDHKKEWQPDGSKVLVPTGRFVQQESVEAMLKEPGGILQLACGLGKTVVFLEIVARLNMPALVIVDTTQLLYQWREEILGCLDVPGGIGLIQGESFDWEREIVLATYQTIANRSDSMPEIVRRHFGVIGWDEGHHISAPTYAAGAHLFYGRRYALTATPERDDGLHIIYRFHVGDVLHKDLYQDIKPDIIFRWTHCELDGTVPENEILDVNQQLSTSKLGVWYGKWIKRMMLVLNDAKEAVQAGRKVIVLSNAVDEAVNFLAIWTWGYPCSLYTDISMPTSLDVGETLSPIYLESADRKKFKRRLEQAGEQLEKNNKRLASKTLHPVKREEIEKKRDGCKAIIAELEQLLEQDKVGRKIMKEKRRLQKEYRDTLLACSTTGGLMIHKVAAAERARLLRTMPITFAISKYGREALDCQELDTVLVSMPFSSRNGLQQVMGRPSREDSRKMSPMVVIYEDNIGPIIGMCKKLRNHINEWPLEDNGPYHYYLFGHPHARNTWKTTVFGP